jgi:biopolymer transport protein ExbD
MKFPRNARIFRGQLDAAPFAAVFFLLLIFLWLTGLVYTPGVPLQLPVADGLPGTDKRPIAVAIGPNGQLYFENQVISENELRSRLRKAVKESPEPLALVIMMDKKVSGEDLFHLTMMARDAGISEALLATLPRVLDSR